MLNCTITMVLTMWVYGKSTPAIGLLATEEDLLAQSKKTCYALRKSMLGVETLGNSGPLALSVDAVDPHQTIKPQTELLKNERGITD